MRRLVIRNVGPIKDVDINLNRINVFIGPQSSGKSTIAKVISTCSWVEKEVATLMDEQAVSDAAAFKSLMVVFHKMIDYFNDDSIILYETEIIKIVLEGNSFSTELKEQEKYRREKICYIPSERNSAALPELQGFEFGQTNLKSFLFDWYNAREFFKEDNKTDILGLGVRYYYDPRQQKYKDWIQHENGKTYQIPLGSASSGLQSVVPLLVMVQYYTGKYFETFDARTSFDTDVKQLQIRHKLTDEVVLKSLFKDEYDSLNRNALIEKANDLLHNRDQEAIQLLEKYRTEVSRLTVPVRTSFILEEPEQNLFPFTQLELMDAIMNLCNGERDHRCTITTHSPYILNYLNVLIARFYKGVTDLAKLDPSSLGVFVTGDGRLTDLIQRNVKTGEISVNSEDLVEAMRYMFTEYREMKEK